MLYCVWKWVLGEPGVERNQLSTHKQAVVLFVQSGNSNNVFVDVLHLIVGYTVLSDAHYCCLAWLHKGSSSAFPLFQVNRNHCPLFTCLNLPMPSRVRGPPASRGKQEKKIAGGQDLKPATCRSQCEVAVLGNARQPWCTCSFQNNQLLCKIHV